MRLVVPGFNEFQEESDIAFYTGILGLPARAFILGHALTPPFQWLHFFLHNSLPLYYGCVPTIFSASLWFTQTSCRLLWLISMVVGLYCFSPCLGVRSRFQFSALAHRSAKLSLFGCSKVSLRAQSGWPADALSL